MDYQLNTPIISKDNFDAQTGLPAFHPLKIAPDLWRDMNRQDLMGFAGAELYPKIAELYAKENTDYQTTIAFSINEELMEAMVEMNVPVDMLRDYGLLEKIEDLSPDEDLENVEFLIYNYDAKSGWEMVAML